MAKPVVRKPKKKVCAFCKDKATYVDYKDTTLLRKFISDRGKIRARRVTGNCTQHQRDVATAKVTKTTRSGGGGGGGSQPSNSNDPWATSVPVGGGSQSSSGGNDPWASPAGGSDEPPF